MRKLRRLPKPIVIRKPVIRKPVNRTNENPKLGTIESDFEAEYQAFIQELRNKKEKNEKVTETETTQDIQSDRQ